MRKMTICRSNGLLMLPVAALLFAAAPAAAQDSLATTEQEGEVHVVRAGETLWTLAEFYLGDPYLWPHIYRINPHVVEDPHWIFPGERLLLIPPDPVAVTEPPMETPGDDQMTPDSLPPDEMPEEPADDVTDDQAAPPPPPPPASSPETETVFASNRFRTGRVPDAPMRNVSRNPARIAFYASGFLTEEDELPWAHVAGATDQTTLGTLTATADATIHETISVVAASGATYQVGDSLLTAHLSREIVGWGNIVRPTGIVVVTAVSGSEVLAEVVSQFGRVTDAQVALPVEPYRDAGASTVSIQGGLTGAIITSRDQNAVPNQRDVFFVDKGRNDGVAIGDVFEAYLEREDFPDTGGRAVAQLTVVHVRSRSATAQITAINDIGFGSGSRVRLIRRAGS